MNATPDQHISTREIAGDNLTIRCPRQGDISVSKRSILEKLGVSDLARIVNTEYPELANLQASTGLTPERATKLVLFNLPLADENLPRIVLPRILVPGSFQNGIDTKPILSFENVWIGQVTQVIAKIDYHNIPDQAFINDRTQRTVGNIHDLESLEAVILSRYQVSMPGLTKLDLIKQGVGIRWLQLEQQVSLSN